VAGGLVVVGKMVHKHILHAQDEETKQLLEKARRQHHFETTEETCSQTLLNLFPSLRQSVADNLNAAILTAQLRDKPEPEKKMQLWNQLKVVAFARCAGLILSGVYISILLRTQLNILAGYLYRHQMDALNNLHQNYNNNSANKKNISSKLQEKYLDISTRFISEGIQRLLSDLSNIVEIVTNQVDLKQKMSLADIEAVIIEIFNQMERSENNRNIFRNPGIYFGPIDSAPEAGDMTFEEKEMFKQLFAETIDVLDSEDTVSLAITVSRQGISHLVDRVAEYYATIGMNVDQPGPSPGTSDKSSLHDSGFVSPANVSLAVAKLIPIMSGLVEISADDQDLWLLHLQENSSIKMLGANVYESFCQEHENNDEDNSWFTYLSSSLSNLF